MGHLLQHANIPFICMHFKLNTAIKPVRYEHLQWYDVGVDASVLVCGVVAEKGGGGGGRRDMGVGL